MSRRGELIHVINPATEEILETVEAGTAADVEAAVGLARNAFPE